MPFQSGNEEFVDVPLHDRQSLEPSDSPNINDHRSMENRQLLPFTSMALVSSTETATSISSEVNPPTNLKDLLKLSIKLNTSGEEENPSTCESYNERVQFLKEAVAEFSTDGVAHLKMLIKILSEIGPDTNDVENYECALNELIEQVCSIDMANLFYQVGGLKVILPLLSHKKETFRWMAANAISECCINNPFCQKLSMADDVMLPLIELVKNDSNDTVKFKAISAVRAIVGNNPESIEQFRTHKGFEILQEALRSGNEQIIAKASLLIIALCDTDGSTKDELVELGITETLISLSVASITVKAEYFLRALLALTNENLKAVMICVKEELGLYPYLKEVLLNNYTKENLKELLHYAHELLQRMKDHQIIEEYKKKHT